MTRRLLLLGCGGHGRVVADAAIDCGFDRIAFLDDRFQTIAPPKNTELLGPLAMAPQLVAEWPAAIVAIADCRMRFDLFMRLVEQGFKIPSVLHPSAVISRNAHISDGVFAAPAAVINVGAHIGIGTIVNTGARVDHDCQIGAACHLAPGATLSGEVQVGERSWLGTGCSVRQGVRIGEDVMVGVGAAVVCNLPGGKTYVGVPAKTK